MIKNNLNRDEVIPLEFYLSQNYPNPFKGKTLIKYCVAYKTKIQIAVYNSEYTEISKIVEEEKNPGTYEIEFNGSGLQSGTYYYRLNAGNFKSEKKWN